MNICSYSPTKYLDDKGYNDRLRFLFKNVCYLMGAGAPGGGTVTSVGLSMPSAFSVAGSPVTTSGTLAVTGAGTTSQYIRGDGSLATYGAIPLSSIVAATATNDIDNTNYPQIWRWNGFSQYGLSLGATTTAALNQSSLFSSFTDFSLLRL